MKVTFSFTEMGIIEFCGQNPELFQNVIQNRQGKTFGMALGAWFAYNEGQEVYCNCSYDPAEDRVMHVLNFPHEDFNPYDWKYKNLNNCYVMVDESTNWFDARVSAKKDIRQVGYMINQARKRGIAFRYDTPRHKNIDPRIRLNPDYIIYPQRIPANWREPLVAIRYWIRGPNGLHKLLLRHPEEFLTPSPIYNDWATIHPVEVS